MRFGDTSPVTFNGTTGAAWPSAWTAEATIVSGTFTPGTNDQTIQSNRGLAIGSMSAANTWRAWRYNATNYGSADIIVEAGFGTPSTTTEVRAGVFARQSGTSTSGSDFTAYAAVLDSYVSGKTTTYVVQPYRIVNGAWSSLSGSVTGDSAMFGSGVNVMGVALSIHNDRNGDPILQYGPITSTTFNDEGPVGYNVGGMAYLPDGSRTFYPMFSHGDSHANKITGAGRCGLIMYHDVTTSITVNFDSFVVSEGIFVA